MKSLSDKTKELIEKAQNGGLEQDYFFTTTFENADGSQSNAGHLAKNHHDSIRSCAAGRK